MKETTSLPTREREILQKQKKYLFPNHILYYTDPLPLERGDGCYVWDVEGNKYLDFFAGILTTSVGHNRPEVNERIKEQSEKIIHSSTLYPNETHINLAEKLAQIAPGDIEVSYFMPSGSEADETAVFLARAHTEHQDIIALRHGYSGRGAVGISLTAHASWRSSGNEVTGIKHAICPNCYRCPLKMSYPSCGVACAEDIEEVIKTTTPGKVAGILLEPIQGVGGFITPPDDYFKIAYEIIKHYDGLFISDEVQTGFGRTGSKWFGIEHSGVQPDVITMAKGIANGLPLANTMTTAGIAQSTLKEGATITTFGGNPVACAAGLGVMEVLENEAHPNHVEEMGRILRDGLDRLKDKYLKIGDVRGKGLMQGLELVTDRETKEPDPKATNQLLDATKKLGLLVGKGGLYGNTVRITPPLTVKEDGIAEALDKLDSAFKQIS